MSTSLPFLKYRSPQSKEADAENPYPDLVRSIKERRLIPFLNNTLRDDRFVAMFGFPGESLEKVIAENWSMLVGYPFEDRSDLARVAQYHQIHTGSALKAKRNFLDFLRNALMDWAEARNPTTGEANDPQGAAKIVEQNLRRSDSSFADLVAELGYPRYGEGEEDPLRLLARLPFEIYVTTSYYDFLERELEKLGKAPRAQVCTWSGPAKVTDKRYLPDPAFEPNEKTPLVFHLFGMERFPETMVLSVDDYLNFLVRIFLREAEANTSDGKGEPKPIPRYLWDKIIGQELLLVGYKLHSWEFQTVFRGIIAGKPASARPDAGLVIQLEAEKQRGVSDREGLKSYLKDYFSQEVKFKLQLRSPERFIDELYRAFQDQS